MRPSLFEFAGGEPAFLALAAAHHARCLADPELNHPFSHPDQHPQHVERLAAYWAEVMGGPPGYSQSCGDQSGVLRMHAGNGDMGDLGDRFLSCFDGAVDDAELPADPAFRAALRAYMSWAVNDVLSYSAADALVAAGAAMPQWGWDGLQTRNGGELGPDDVADELGRSPRTVAEAHRKPSDGGLPESHGVYAWWMVPGALGEVRGRAHPSQALELLYVGIAPKDARSKATLRSRVRGQHLGGNIGSSTFRQSLAALLFEDHGWITRWSGSRAQLIPEHNSALSEWQRDQLRLAWVPRTRPWLVEARVIALMRPPLNLAGNAAHPMGQQLAQLRAKLREGAE